MRGGRHRRYMYEVAQVGAPRNGTAMAGRTRPGFGRDGWQRPGSSKINDSSTKPGQRAMGAKERTSKTSKISRSTIAALLEGRRLKSLYLPNWGTESCQNASILFLEEAGKRVKWSICRGGSINSY